jgi:hypothetical protein
MDSIFTCLFVYSLATLHLARRLLSVNSGMRKNSLFICLSHMHFTWLTEAGPVAWHCPA